MHPYELSSLRSGTVPQLERDLKEKVGIIRKAEADVQRVEGELNQLRSEMEQVRGLQPRVMKVSQLRKELKELDKKISLEESKLGGGDGGRSHHIVNRELQEAQRNVDELNRKMDHKRQEITDCQQTLQQLKEKVHSLREEKLRLQSQLQKREALVSKKGELTAKIESLDREVKTLINRIGPVRQKMQSVVQERQRAAREREESETNSREEVDSFRAKEHAIKDNNQAIMRYINGGSDKALQECESRLNELQSLESTKNAEKKSLESKIKLLQEQLANEKVRERELSDSLQVIELGAEIGRKEKEVKKLKEQLRSMGLDKYEEEFSRLQHQVDHLRKEQARREGQKQGQEDQARHIQRELQSDLYSGTETRHKDMLAKLKTTERANKDLEKYYKALDRAIMRYHSIKMEEINKIIKELWNKTYKGGDIDTIEIRSEDGKEEGGASLASRRTYNYRVVMLKGGTPLDMRGRCSAGQKVLACIIIRLALAETFCLHSGLLALDEPTTNLDKDNVDGLAQALADIVKERSKNQKNFQLIIISHDEAFVDLISRSGYAECYYKVSKSVGECSKIARRRFAGD